jgi:hypothetical protein
MEQKKSIVRTVTYKRSINGQLGLLHAFEIRFENGDHGDYLSKSQSQKKFVEGTEAKYQIGSRQSGKYLNYVVKPVETAPQASASKPNPELEHKSTALRCAVDLAAAGVIKTDKISDFAGSFMKFLTE